MTLSLAEQEFVRRAREFARDHIALKAGTWNAAHLTLPREAIAAWAQHGLNSLQVSAARGGGGTRFHCKLEVAQAVAAECFVSAFALNNMQGSVTRLEREGSAEQIERYLKPLMRADTICSIALSEPGAGSDFAAIRTRATKIPGGWVLDGEKAWITNGAIAGLFLVYAQTDPSAGWRGIGSFLVEAGTPGTERLAPESLTGGSPAGVAGLRLIEVRLRDGELFAPPGEAFKRGMKGITGARIHVAAMICATAASALRLAIAHAGAREAFGKKLLDHQGLRWQLADVATELEAARLLVARAADLFEAGADAQVEAAFAKKYAAEMAARGIAACMQAMGAEGLRASCPLGRHLAAARIAAIVDGTTEIQSERIGAALAQRYGPAA